MRDADELRLADITVILNDWSRLVSTCMSICYDDALGIA